MGCGPGRRRLWHLPSSAGARPRDQGTVGPSLAGVGLRLNEAALRALLTDARALRPGTVMPSYGRPASGPFASHRFRGNRSSRPTFGKRSWPAFHPSPWLTASRRRQALAGSGGAPTPTVLPRALSAASVPETGISAIFSKPISAIRCRPRAAFGWTYLARRKWSLRRRERARGRSAGSPGSAFPARPRNLRAPGDWKPTSILQPCRSWPPASSPSSATQNSPPWAAGP